MENIYINRTYNGNKLSDNIIIGLQNKKKE